MLYSEYSESLTPSSLMLPLADPGANFVAGEAAIDPGRQEEEADHFRW